MGGYGAHRGARAIDNQESSGLLAVSFEGEDVGCDAVVATRSRNQRSCVSATAQPANSRGGSSTGGLEARIPQA